MINAYHQENFRRALCDETLSHIREKTGSTVILGLSEILCTGDAIFGGPRVAGFMETHDIREWCLPLSATNGLKWKTDVVENLTEEKVSFILSIGFGNGSPIPQPSGRWDIYVNDRFAVSVRVVKHSQLWEGPECSLAFTANRIEAAEPGSSLYLSSIITSESFAAFGPALLTIPCSWVQSGEAAEIRIESPCNTESTRWFQLASSPHLVEQADIYGVVDLLAHGRSAKVSGHRVYFGDIHTHSGQLFDKADDQGCGVGSRDDNYSYAQGPGGLDFYALTEHEWQVDPDGIEAYLELADKYNQDGHFVCLPAFEFTNQLYGHRCVYFRGSGGTVINANRDWGLPTRDPEKALTPKQLWDELSKTDVKFMTVPHHTSSASHPFTWNFLDLRYDRLAEVYSCWGSSEYYGDFPKGVTDRYRTLDIQEALRTGHRFGLIASSDGHDCHPGNAQSPCVKHHHVFHYLGSGYAAVLSNELSREAIFDALFDRRCYGTTGVPIVLSFSVNGHVMGSELESLNKGKIPQLTINCQGANGIDHIRIIKNSRVVHTEFCHGKFEYDLEWEDKEYKPEYADNYYVRVVQVDRESAWSSPVWIG